MFLIVGMQRWISSCPDMIWVPLARVNWPVVIDEPRKSWLNEGPPPETDMTDFALQKSEDLPK